MNDNYDKMTINLYGYRRGCIYCDWSAWFYITPTDEQEEYMRVRHNIESPFCSLNHMETEYYED